MTILLVGIELFHADGESWQSYQPLITFSNKPKKNIVVQVYTFPLLRLPLN